MPTKICLSSNREYSGYIKNSKNFDSQNPVPVTNQVNEMNRHFSKEEVSMANKFVKKCSVSLSSGKMQQFTTILRFHLLPVKMAVVKNTKIVNTEKDARERNIGCYIPSKNCK